jgi:hypothetical protein
MSRYLLTFLSFLSGILVIGQYAETIRSGRPGQAIGAFSLGARTFQVQSGLTYNELDHGSIRSWGTVIRFGLSERLETSAVLNYERDRFEIGQETITIDGLSDSQFGLRYHLTDQKKWLPAICIQGRALLKLQTEEFKREDTGAKFILATGHRLSDKFSLTTNWAATWNGNAPSPIPSYILNLSYGISDKFGTFAELYGGLDPWDRKFDAGLFYLVNKDLQLDFSAGQQGTDSSTDWFGDIGISWRTDWRNAKGSDLQ